MLVAGDQWRLRHLLVAALLSSSDPARGSPARPNRAGRSAEPSARSAATGRERADGPRREADPTPSPPAPARRASLGTPDRAPSPWVSVPEMGTYVRLLGGLAVGRGIRLNNPYRLSTQLGDTAESLSLTATYADAFVAAALGDPDGWQHGIAVHGAAALDGIAQEVVTPGYLLILQLGPRWLFAGRIGLPIIIEPDAGVGYELGLGTIGWLTASFGLGAELVGSVFQGAATPETGRTTIPVVSLQLGGAYQFEVLP